MTQQTQYPTGTVSNAWTVSPAGQPWEAVDDPAGAPDDATYVSAFAPFKNCNLSHPGFAVPAGSVVNSVIQFWRAKETVAARTWLRINLKNPNSWHTAGPLALTAAYVDRTRTWLTNPATGLAWTIDQVAQVGANAINYAISFRSANTTVEQSISQAHLLVDYSLPAALSVVGPAGAIADGETTPVDFGVGYADDPATVSFSVTNDGEQAATGVAVTVPAGFEVTTALPATIAASATHTLTVALTGPGPGTWSGDVSISSSDPASPYNFAVVGWFSSIAVSPVGPLGDSVRRLVEMLARCLAWQAVAAPGETAGTNAAIARALGSIFVLDIDTDPGYLAALRPYSLVTLTDEFDALQFTGGSVNYIDRGGALGLYVCDLDRENDDSAAARRRSAYGFLNLLDGLVEHFRDVAQTDNNLSTTEINLAQRPRRSPRADDASAGAFFDVILSIRWK